MTPQPYYQDDATSLFCGDSLDVLQHLPTASVDAVVTDPPYSSGGQFRGDRMGSTGEKYGGDAFADFAGDNRDQRSFLLWMNLWLGECTRVVKPGGAAVLFTDWRQLPTMTDALQIAGWTWRGLVPWAKPHGRPAFKQRAYLNQCEYIAWGTNGYAVTDGGETTPLPGFYQAAAPRERVHQTQKPLDVMRALVKIVPEGGVILDPFLGSGTTGIAAVIEHRRFVGIEMVESYADIAAKRIRIAAGQAVPSGTQAAFDFEEEGIA